MGTWVSDAEFGRRRAKVRETLAERDLGAACLFSPHGIFYLTGFSFIATERPIAFVWPFSQQPPALFVPLLEREHAEEAHAVEVITYPEYPNERHPMQKLGDLLHDLGVDGKKIGVDSDGYGGGYGYRGPKLSEVFHTEIVQVGAVIDRMMWIKSSEEILLLKESAKWANLAHSLLQEHTRPGRTEIEISTQASQEAAEIMIRTLGPDYRPAQGGMPAYTGFRGQIGVRSAIPHAITTGARIREGDVLVTGASADVGGYGAELERTMIVGKPNERSRRLFELMLAAQDLAFEQINPGRRCAEVDQAVRDFYAKQGIMDYWRHHTGHALGIRMHEAPFLDIGDDTVIEPGMVFSVEPGIYVPGFAGFRHSDTVVVTPDGLERITYYPRDLESLTIA